MKQYDIDITKLTPPKPLSAEEVAKLFPESKVLDITDWKYTGKELHDQITNACDPSHSAIVQRLYDQLLLTEDQYRFN